MTHGDFMQYQTIAFLGDTIRMFRILNLPVRPMKTIEEMDDMHGRLLDAINNPEGEAEEYVDYIPMPKEFPKPPFPGRSWIHPLTTPKMLVTEGREQKNCVASLMSEVAAGWSYVYKITWPERATLSIMQFTGCWVVDQIYATRNHLVANRTIRKVEEWLYECSLGISRDDEDPEKLEMPDVLTRSEREECVNTAKKLLSREKFLTGAELTVLEAVIEGELFNLQRFREIAINHGLSIQMKI